MASGVVPSKREISSYYDFHNAKQEKPKNSEQISGIVHFINLSLKIETTMVLKEAKTSRFFRTVETVNRTVKNAMVLFHLHRSIS